MSEVHIVSVLDRSASMWPDRIKVIDSYNAFIAEQKKNRNVQKTFTLNLFDRTFEEVYRKLLPDEVPILTENVYKIGTSTSLFDAVGLSILSMGDSKNVIFFIETDGFENTSREFSGPMIKELIEKKKAEGWEFIFAGADLNTDIVSRMGTSLGINLDKTLSFKKDAAGYNMRTMFYASAVDDYTVKSTE